ncbi:MAG: metallophosphoesterase [Pseudomonadota bacterium]
MKIRNPLIIVLMLLTVLFSVSSCGDGAPGDWADLPGYLDGGIVVYGDSRTGHREHRWLVEGMATLGPEAVFHTGDLVTDGRLADNWITFNDIASQLPSGTPIYPALGNHEHESELYFDNFELPGNERWYAVDDLPGVKFIVLDSGSDLSSATNADPASEQYAWLESELKSSVSDTVYTLVAFHYPLYSTGYHGSDEKDLADDLVPLFEQYGVDAVFNGHDHDYERSTVDGIRYIVTGGGGAPLRNQAGTSEYSDVFAKAYHFCVLYFDQEGKLMAEAWSAEVKLIDRFEITNR